MLYRTMPRQCQYFAHVEQPATLNLMSSFGGNFAVRINTFIFSVLFVSGCLSN